MGVPSLSTPLPCDIADSLPPSKRCRYDLKYTLKHYAYLPIETLSAFYPYKFSFQISHYGFNNLQFYISDSVGMDYLIGYHQFVSEVQEDIGVHHSPVSMPKNTSSDWFQRATWTVKLSLCFLDSCFLGFRHVLPPWYSLGINFSCFPQGDDGGKEIPGCWA